MVGHGHGMGDHVDDDRRDRSPSGCSGYLLDRLFGIEDVFLPIGFILGGAAGVYIIWLRYGRGEGDET